MIHEQANVSVTFTSKSGCEETTN